MPAPFRVMTVCTGNICRSPMAEIVLRDRFEAAGLDGLVVVDSGGVSDEERGNPVDRRARATLAAHGYPAGDGHRARRVRPEDLETHDLVLAMTAQHARALRRMAPTPEAAARVVLYRRFDPAAPEVGPDGPEYLLDVDDPWFGGPEDFELCLTEIEAAADGVVATVRERVGR